MEWKDEDIKRLKMEVADKIEIEVELIVPSARIKEDLGADSLDLYELMYMLDAEFGIAYSEDKMSELKTVQDFMDLVGINLEDKCKWEDGELCICAKHKGFLSMIIANNTYIEQGYKLKYCPFCGADIRKPEPEQPSIKKSGGTWVYRADGVDYFVTRPEEAKSEHCLLTLINNCGAENAPCAKPIIGLEITDEIAKLRPAVVDLENNDLYRLWGIIDECAVLTNGNEPVSGFRLATVEDL